MNETQPLCSGNLYSNKEREVRNKETDDSYHVVTSAMKGNFTAKGDGDGVLLVCFAR